MSEPSPSDVVVQSTAFIDVSHLVRVALEMPAQGE